MLRVCSTEGCLPIRNVCLFNDGKGAFKNIMRRLPEQLPELPEECVCVCVCKLCGWCLILLVQCHLLKVKSLEGLLSTIPVKDPF